MNNSHPEHLPDEIRRELASMPNPSEEESQQFAFFVDGIRAHLERLSIPPVAAPARSLSEIIHAVFTTAGKLLDATADGVREILAPPPRPALATRGIKGGEAPPRPVSADDSFLSGITISGEGATIRVEWQREKEGPVVEIGVVDQKGAIVRPLDITVSDETGEPITEVVHVPEMAANPRFPQPSAGVYIFHVSWPDGEQEIRMEVREA
jgi:hypothetical protein